MEFLISLKSQPVVSWFYSFKQKNYTMCFTSLHIEGYYDLSSHSYNNLFIYYPPHSLKTLRTFQYLRALVFISFYVSFSFPSFKLFQEIYLKQYLYSYRQIIHFNQLMKMPQTRLSLVLVLKLHSLKRIDSILSHQILSLYPQVQDHNRTLLRVFHILNDLIYHISNI